MYLMAAFNQRRGNVRPDEPGTACQEDFQDYLSSRGASRDDLHDSTAARRPTQDGQKITWHRQHEARQNHQEAFDRQGPASLLAGEPEPQQILGKAHLIQQTLEPAVWIAFD